MTGVNHVKKAISLILAVLTALSVLSATAFAAQTQPLLVYDLLKHDTDSATHTCRTVEIFFQQQMKNFDSAKEITFRTSDDKTVAVCRPHSDNIRMLDLYTPGGEFGVVLDSAKQYYLTIPEGAYYTDDGILCAAYKGAYNGVHLSDNDAAFSIADLGISEFLATNVSGNKLFAGRIRISNAFDGLRAANKAVTLLRKTGVNKTTGKDVYEAIGTYTVTALRKGSADISFDGAVIDRYADYKLEVNFGTFMAGKTTVNGRSEYALSGKKLLGLREDYPVIDLLIRWFGADHRVLKAVTTALRILASVNLVDKALYNDVDAYIKAHK